MSETFKIHVVGHGEVEARAGERLVNALRRGGVDILHRCGGQGRCTTCRVEFTQGEPEAMTEAEYAKLLEKGFLGQARLSCQILCASDMQLKPLQTALATGLEAGKEPAEQIEPEAVWR